MTFLVISILYFVFKILSFFLTPSPTEIASVVPGWHTIIEYRVIYRHFFTAVYFLAIAALYGFRGLKYSKSFFWMHVVFSIIPLVMMLLWPLYFKTNDYDIDRVTMEYQASELLERFFLISQGIFISIILFRQWKAEKLRTTWAFVNMGFWKSPQHIIFNQQEKGNQADVFQISILRKALLR